MKIKLKEISKKYFLVEAAVFAAVIIFDLLTKSIAKSSLESGKTIPILGSLLELRYTTNFGASYGMFANAERKNIIFFITTLIGLGFFGFLLYYARNKKPLFRIGIVLMLAGAVGNAIDRMVMPDKNGGYTFFSGGVRDFIYLNLGFSPFQFICNIADIALTAGVVIFAVMFIFFDKDEEKTAKESPEKNT